MMKRWISMLLALMLLMLGMATAEDAADDAWEYELVGRAIELVRQMDAQERGRLFEDTLNITEVACTETPQPIDRGMPQQAFISVSVNGTDKSASVLFFVLMMMDASADTDATDETENAYLRIVERTFAVSPEFGMDAQETSAAANLLYAGDAPEMGLLLLSYGENGAVLVRWFAENGCVCLTAIPAAHQATELTTDKLSEFYAGEFEEVDLSCAVALAELEPHQPDEDTIRQLALQSAQEMQHWAALSGEQEGIVPWNTAETAVQISILDYDASQMTAFEAQMQQCGKTETKFLDILAIALYPCDAHDTGGLLYLRPRAGTPIVVAWQAMNGAVVMRSVYAPQERRKQLQRKEEPHEEDACNSACPADDAHRYGDSGRNDGQQHEYQPYAGTVPARGYPPAQRPHCGRFGGRHGRRYHRGTEDCQSPARRKPHDAICRLLCHGRNAAGRLHRR